MTTQVKNFVKTGKDQHTEKVETLIREYKQKRWAPNSARIGKPDSLSVRYSIEELERFLTIAKSHGGDGIKFYYGAYPENESAQPEYASRQTLILVATKSKKNANGIAADKDIYIRKNGNVKILGTFGPGLICPPYCSAPAEGGMGDLGITIIDKGSKGMEII